MNRNERLRAVFDGAIVLPRSARAAFLDASCGEDNALLEECVDLIKAYEGAIEEDQATSSRHEDSFLANSPKRATLARVLSDGEVFGSYRIVRLLGRGGMGEVYEAEHLDYGRRVALKILRDTQTTRTDRARFLREGRLAASINHPNTVYVYGTEEVEGRPMILMEFVGGGTLNDRVRSTGPMPMADAVEAARDIVAGLAAAWQHGILHRDVKPSNCYVDSSGRVKVGDFGLSIPTAARDETHLTEVGTMFGTPAFCSPEQLAGEALDERTDIYGVGATLYFLLTGKAPFDCPNLVKLVTSAIHDRPQAPRSLRPDIPSELEQLVLRCLEKNAAKRFRTYAELHEALSSFARRDTAPAGLIPRTFAGLVDGAAVVILWHLCNAAIQARSADIPRQAELILIGTAGLVLTVAYLWGFERWRGATPGKLICGLRVAPAASADVTLRHVGTRSLIFVVLLFLLPLIVPDLRGGPTQAAMPFVRGRTFPAPSRIPRVAPTTLVHAFGLLLIFSTARKRNGYRGLHEFLSGTRTVTEARDAASTLFDLREKHIAKPGGPRIGPYILMNEPDALQCADTAVPAFDPALCREVWLDISKAGAQPVTAARRNLDRPGRLRWLAGKHDADEHWDAYEQVEGTALLQLIAERQPFEVVRVWLADLARELRDGCADRTLHELTMGRLWITPAGRLKVLDMGAPQTVGSVDAVEPIPLDLLRGQHFLFDLATATLREGTANARRSAERPLPPFATRLLHALGERSFTSLDEVVAACEAAASRDLEISRPRRAGPILAATLVGILGIEGQFTRIVESSRLRKAVSVHIQFDSCLATLFQLQNGQLKDATGSRLIAAQMCVAALSQSVEAGARQRWEADEDNRRMITESRTLYPRASQANLQALAAELPPRFKSARSMTAGPDNDTGRHFATTYALMNVRRLAWFGAGAAILLAGLFGRGPLFRLMRVAVLTRDGRKVSRVRAVVRAMLIWAPLVAGTLLTLLTCPKPAPPLEVFGNSAVIFAFAPLLIPAASAIYSVLNPSRGIAERLTGTWLVRE